MTFTRFYEKAINKLLGKRDIYGRDEIKEILLGKILASLNNKREKINSLQEVEFKVFSQWGDDGIIQYLIHKIEMPKTFVEFGVETYVEANTRFLLMNNNWSGLVIDGSNSNIEEVHDQLIYWKHDLKAVAAFITTENINSLISSNGFSGEIGILSVDIDGNDYWVLDTIDVVNAVVIVVEYNAAFGEKRYISTPYSPSFFRTAAHFSNLYYGASLPALVYLCDKKGYTFIGCNTSGNNAYFVRNDKLGNLPTPTIEEGYVSAKFRESRTESGKLALLTNQQEVEVLKGLDVVNVKTNSPEIF